MPAGGPDYTPPASAGGGAVDSVNGATGVVVLGASDVGAVDKTLYDAKGDIITSTAADTPAKLTAGADHKAIMANAGESTGLLYGYPQDLRAKYLCPTGAIETMPRHLLTASQQSYMVSGRVQMTAIALPKGFLVTNLSFVAGSTGVSGASHCWQFLANSSYSQLRATADDTSATPWNANTVKTQALSSTFTTTYEGLYYIGVMVAGTVGTTLVQNVNIAAAYNISPYISVAGLSGQTTPTADATNMAPSPTQYGYAAYAYVT